jgi:hypothetical protein
LSWEACPVNRGLPQTLIREGLDYRGPERACPRSYFPNHHPTHISTEGPSVLESNGCYIQAAVLLNGLVQLGVALNVSLVASLRTVFNPPLTMVPLGFTTVIMGMLRHDSVGELREPRYMLPGIYA